MVAFRVLLLAFGLLTVVGLSAGAGSVMSEPVTVATMARLGLIGLVAIGLFSQIKGLALLIPGVRKLRRKPASRGP